MNPLFWIITIALLAVAVAAAILALTMKRPRLIIVAAAALVAAYVSTSLAPEDVPGWVTVLVALLGLTLATVGGGSVVDTTLDLATPGQRHGAHGGILLTRPTPVPPPATGATGTAPTAPTAIGQPIEVLRGGTTIGVLERIAAAGSIMTGSAEAIAAVIAIKGLGRFTELSSPEARERFIIGTLASLLWASACGTLARIYLG
ncbi:hypothetical protein HQQ81_04870 [Microbacteriaceae bacterium VKM Ac-2854]|nr:hypothetical protein [Microbacteriaceae bacterium VKM Ac-2854]